MKTTINGFQGPKTHLYGPVPVDTINRTGGHVGFDKYDKETSNRRETIIIRLHEPKNLIFV